MPMTDALPPPGVRFPRVVIQFCTQCKWMLRAAYVGFLSFLASFLPLSLFLPSFLPLFIFFLHPSFIHPSSIPPSSIHPSSLLPSPPIQLTSPVRARAPLHVPHLPRRSLPPALHRRHIHRHRPRRPLVAAPDPVGQEARRRLPRDQGAQEAREGRGRAGEGPGTRRSGRGRTV